MSKMSSVLAEKFEGLPLGEALDVVLELGEEAIHALDQADSAETMRRIYAEYAEPVKGKIRLLGGSITGEGWLNGTLQATLTKGAVESLDDEPVVARVDLPRLLERE